MLLAHKAWRLSEKELDEVEADDVGSQYRIVWCECIREQVAAAIEQIMWKTDTDGSMVVSLLPDLPMKYEKSIEICGYFTTRDIPQVVVDLRDCMGSWCGWVRWHHGGSDPSSSGEFMSNTRNTTKLYSEHDNGSARWEFSQDPYFQQIACLEACLQRSQ